MDTLVMDNKQKPSQIGEEPVSEQPIQSYIVVRFADFGSAVLNIQFMNVNAAQMFAAAKFLEMRAEMYFVMEEQQRLQREAEQAIAKPAQTILKPH